MRSPKSQHQTAIVPQHKTPDRPNLNLKQRSPLTTHKPDRLFLNIKSSDRTLIIQTPIAYSQSSQTAIAPSPPTNPIAYSPKSNSDRTSTLTDPIAYFPHQTAIAPHHPQM